jgi:alanine racemase
LELTSSDIARITGSALFGPSGIAVTELATDSRQINITDSVLFIAIKGQNHDGHEYINSLYEKGLRTFLVSRLPSDIGKYPEAAFILNDNSVKALQKLAAYKRSLFRSPVIAITGSAGKTIVKEWLSDVIGQSAAVVRSPKSYNSQIGVPLSVWKLDSKFSYGIFEAGISMPGEMENLQKVIDPDIGVITNIGEAHSRNFADNCQKAAEKLKLFINCSMIIYCADHSLIHELISKDKNLGKKILISWSFIDREAGIFVTRKQLTGGGTLLTISYKGVSNEFEIPFSDRASVENAITVAAVCLALGIGTDLLRKGLSELVSVAMRMEMKGGINNCTLIEDFYNSDPGSLGIALEYLRSQNHLKTILILSDFIQNGRDEEELYTGIADLVSKMNIDSFIGIGKALMKFSFLFASGSAFYLSTDDFVRDFNSSGYSDSLVLIKGARIFEFEKIGRLLEQQVHITVLEINLDAISHNLNEFRRKLDPGTRIMVMVKAFAYGSGPAEIASLLEYHRVSYLAVAYTDEGVGLRNAGVTLPVMVMNPDPPSADMMIKHNLEPEIYSFASLEKFTAAASKHGLYQYPVHIKIDTGMHRLGFLLSDIDRLTVRLKDLDCIKVVSVFSHLAGSDDPRLDGFTHHQAEVFDEAALKIRSALGYPFLRHILNTSGIIRFPQYQYDMVRPGIGIYGVGHYEGIELKPAGRFKSRISQIKNVPAGEPVGYGCADVSDKERIIATVPVGYADGLNRRLGNGKGNLFIKGRRAPVTGNICMDMCMADITGIDVKEGDEAEIFGENISISELALQCETIPYEILTSIPGRVKRVFFRE